MTLFTSDLPLETAMRVWDVVVLNHSSAAVEAEPHRPDDYPADDDGINRRQAPFRTQMELGPTAVGGTRHGDGCAVLLAASLAAIVLVRPELELASDPGKLSLALSSGVASLQPGPTGDRFMRELSAQYSW